ncbi:MAG: hypothetical protein WBV85_05120 [Solirubrobacteraceae bacterium]
MPSYLHIVQGLCNPRTLCRGCWWVAGSASLDDSTGGSVPSPHNPFTDVERHYVGHDHKAGISVCVGREDACDAAGDGEGGEPPMRCFVMGTNA